MTERTDEDQAQIIAENQDSSTDQDSSQEQAQPQEGSLFPEFDRNHGMIEMVYDRKKLESQNIVIIGNNATSEELVKQLLVFGFRDVYLWDPARDEHGNSKAAATLRRLNHISPHYRGRQGHESLEARAITAAFDALGIELYNLLGSYCQGEEDSQISSKIVINTLNNSAISDIVLRDLLNASERGLCIDAHAIQDHENRLYGLNIQTAATVERDYQSFDIKDHIENRNLSLFDDKPHDHLMAIICASYTTAFLARYILGKEADREYFAQPTSFTLFPFAEDPLSVGHAAKEVHYNGFFGDKGIYLAGLGGGTLVLDTLVNIFNVNRLLGVEKDTLERTNFNRLIPFIDQRLIGKKKTEAARRAYSDFINSDGKNIRFIDGVIFDDLLVGEEEEDIDIIIGGLSGFDNKLNLVALSQELASKKEHILVDIGVEPFRFDITPYLRGVTPCDYCRNLHDLALQQYFANNLPNCDLYPQGSTIFSNYLGVIALIEAMKYADPELGKVTTGSITGNLFPPVHNPGLLYEAKPALEVIPKDCLSHQSTKPLNINPDDYISEEGFEKGWNVKRIYEKADGKNKKGRHVGTFRYSPWN